MGNFASSHCPRDGGAQTGICTHTSSPICSQSVIVEKPVATFRYTLGTDEKGSLEYPSTMEKAPAEKCYSNFDVLCKWKFNNLEEFMALSTLVPKSKYRVLISVRDNTGRKRPVRSLLEMEARWKIVNSSFLAQVWCSYVKPGKVRH